MASRRSRSLFWQLGAGIIALQALVLVALGWYAFYRIEGDHIDRRTDELDRLAQTLGRRYDETPGFADVEALREAVRRDGASTGARITVIDERGVVLADSHHDATAMERHGDRPEISEARVAGRGTATRFSSTLDMTMLYLARRKGPDGPTIRAALPLDTIQAQLRSLVRALAVAGLLSLALTSLGIALLSHRVTGSIGRLARGAARLASGDLRHRLPRPASRELVVLTDALNEMAAQHGAQIDRLTLQRAEQQAILQSMSNGVIALDLEQRILTLNRAAETILEVDGVAIRGRLLQEVVREPDLSRFTQAAVDAPGQGPTQLTLGSEPPRHLLAHAETLTDLEGQPAGLLVIIDDVTTLRRLESIRSDFAANVSHELRTPVTNINGYVETLLDMGVDPADDEQRLHFLEVIRQNCDRLAAIIEDMLALARLEQPGVLDTLERHSHRVEGIVESVAGQLASLAAAKGMTIRREIPPDLAVNVHGQLAEQAVANLLSNALNYSPPGTTVTISAIPEGEDMVSLAVADEGPGIPTDARMRIFERFYRVDSARSRALGGTGLGLALVKHIALVHGGRVEVDSEVGRGSTFRLLLPKA